MKNGDNLIHSFNHTSDTEGNFKGLTKREYFAGLAMQALFSNPETLNHVEGIPSMEDAVRFADKLLEELEKKKK